MPRIARIARAGVVHHVIARFVDRSWQLRDDEERAAYLSRLATALLRSDWVLLAYALMSSHVHLVLEAGEASLGMWSKSTHSPMARWLNDRHGRLGPVFAGRPYAEAVAPSAVPMLMAYVHNNPVRAKLVARAEESTWTSHAAYLRLSAPRSPLSVARGLALCGYANDEHGRLDFAEWVAACAGTSAPFAELSSHTERDALRRAHRTFGACALLGTPTASTTGRDYPVLVPSGAALQPIVDGLRADEVLARVEGVVGLNARGRRATDRRRSITNARRIALTVWQWAGQPRIQMARALGISAGAASDLVNRRPGRVPMEQAQTVIDILQSERRVAV